MKFLKHFESDKQFREVDLQKLWDDFDKYKKELFSSNFTFPETNITCFDKRVLEPLLMNKEVEFHKTKSPIDDEIRFGFEGRIKFINVERTDNILNVYVSLEKESIGTLREDRFILAKIIMRFRNITKPYPNVVKIYNSWTTEIEDKINMLNNAEKYNL